MTSTKIVILAFLIAAFVGVTACRRQVTVSNAPASQPVNSATPQQYHLDTAALPIPQTKYFKGSIGSQLGLQMKLTRDGDKVNGTYFYQKVGAKIEVKGTIDKENNLTLEEFDAGGKQTGLFKGSWTTNEDGLADVAGNWSKPNSDKKTAFSLHEQPIEFSNAVEMSAKSIKENNKKLNYQIDAEYPQATGAADNRFEKFNQEAKGLVIKRVGEFKKETAAIASDQSSAAGATPTPVETAASLGSTLDIGYDIALAKDDLISIRFDLGSYSAGAAHPNSYSAVLNYDVNNNKVLKLADLFASGAKYLQALSTFCIKDLKRQSKGKGSLLDDASIQGGAGPEARNYQSWTITKKGLEISFDAYQVGPYAAGPQKVIVPYSALKELIRTDGPLAQFVK
jgi:Protein of unknown function (DUF3298)